MISIERFIDPSGPVSGIANTPVVSCTENERIRNSVATVLNGFSRMIVQDRGEMKGFVTSLDVLDFLGGGPRYQTYVKYNKGLNLSVNRIMNSEWHPLGKKRSIEEALGVFHKHGNEFHPIIDNNRLSGVLSEMDFLRHIRGPLGVRTKDIMDKKPIIAKSHYNVRDVAKMLVRGEYRFLPVVKKEFMVGVVTPHDIISYLSRGIGLNSLRKAEFEITAAMNRDFVSVEPDSDLSAAVKLMNDNNIGNIPVTDEGEMLGLVTRRDVVDILS